jgi:amidase
MPEISTFQSGAFVDEFLLPPFGPGALDGLRFAVKDLVDVAGRRTGCGNPDWLASHPLATVSAVCVEQLLAAGATCVGKTVCDELAFSLIGENHFYGTPLNPAAPDRVPGGSSSGSASAVACGLADFALGTDTAGSIRIPANNCGVWGMRPTHGRVSVAGVMPFSPSFDTVGVLARDVETLQRAMSVLLGEEVSEASGDLVEPSKIHVLTEAFALADADVRRALESPIDELRRRDGNRVCTTSLAELCCDAAAADLAVWRDTFRLVRVAEVESCLGAWIAATHPTFGPAASASFASLGQLDRAHIGPAIHRREQICRALQQSLAPRDLLCIPTAPTIAPLKGSADHDRNGDYYTRTIALTSLAGIARLPQVSLPLANVHGAPIGLSIIGGHGYDAYLLRFAATISK